jgi:cytoskeletal protein CcmA (bactofilin family)
MDSALTSQFIRRNKCTVKGSLTVNGRLHVKGALKVQGEVYIGPLGDLIADDNQSWY